MCHARWLRLVVDEGHELGHGQKDDEDGNKDSAGKSRGSSSSSGKKRGRRKSSSAFDSAGTGIVGLGFYSKRGSGGAATLDEEVSSSFHSPSTMFISQIAAERRWVMSGTPTTGSQTMRALEQLQVRTYIQTYGHTDRWHAC
jgi:hypothetical protein